MDLVRLSSLIVLVGLAAFGGWALLAALSHARVVFTPVADGLLRAMSDAVLVVDDARRIVSVNQATVDLLGWPESELAGADLGMVLAGTPGPWLDAVLGGAQVRDRELPCRRRGRSDLTVALSASAIRLGAGPTRGAVLVLRDLTELRAKEDELRHLATHDPLTDLPNRLLFHDRLAQGLARAERTDRKVVVLFLGVDRFKDINEALGYDVGDVLLQAVASRLAQCLRRTDTLSRMGGDEFAAVLPELHDAADAEIVVRRMQQALLSPFEVAGHRLHVGCSIGSSHFPEHGSEPENLTKCADIALDAAKLAGGGAWMAFSPAMARAVSSRHELRYRLRRALEDGQLVLHYQPQVDTATGAIVAVEALVRWRDPRDGLVPPASFIPDAEESGIIIRIGEWVLREACAQARRWRDEGHRSLRMAVNLSARQFAHADLVDTVQRVLADTGLEPSSLELEITEHTAMRDADETDRTLSRLRDLGVRIALDDFGTGYSSLVYLKRFTVDTLKIGQAFIRDVNERTESAAIVSAIVGLASSLGLHTTVAEGVETEAQLETVRALHCPFVQGFLFSRPVPAAELEDLLRRAPAKQAVS